MKRRGFLGFFGGAVVAGPRIAHQAVSQNVLGQAGYAQGMGHAAPMAMEPITEGVAAQIVKFVKKNGIPEWKMNELRERANHMRDSGLDPDLAALVSVSGGWKAREQRRRTMNRVVESSLISISREAARKSFVGKIKDKLGVDYFDWYG